MSELLPCPFCGSPAEIDPRPVEWPDWWGCTVWCSAINTHQCSAQIIAAGDTEQEAIEAAVAAWNRRVFEFTRDDVEGAFVEGYAVACERQDDENEDTLEETMEDYGWIRERTCKVVRYDAGDGVIWLACSECGNIMPEHDNYCSNCGARVLPKISDSVCQDASKISDSEKVRDE